MKLLLTCPASCLAERNWVHGVVLGEYLGLGFETQQGAEGRITLSGGGRVLELDDSFFRTAGSRWLAADSLPPEPLRDWVVPGELDARLVSPAVPVLYGSAGITWQASGDAVLHLDVFGSAFMLLSRYEEAAISARDAHDRFPATASLAARAGFLDRPLADEYVEILWAVMKRLWPQLDRRPRRARTLVSCDVDAPFDAAANSLRRLVRGAAARVLRERRFPGLPTLWRNYRASARGDYAHDPFRPMLDWIMDVNERAGNRVAFYIIPDRTHPVLDNDFPVQEPRMRALLRVMHDRGHEIGMHPGYNTYRDRAALARSVACLRQVMKEENIRQATLGGRQHFLRWDPLVTAALWDAEGLDYDTTLSYADRPGFRCGTCREYPLYDLAARRALRVRERPLVLMECSVIAKRYMGLGYSETAFELMHHYKSVCRRFDGDFTLLWHNSHLQHPDDRRFYLSLIAA